MGTWPLLPLSSQASVVMHREGSWPGARVKRALDDVTRWRGPLFLVAVVASVFLCSGCSSGVDSTDDVGWGSEALIFVEALSDAYSREDFYDTLDFYSPNAEIEVLKGNFDGGPVVDLLSIGPILGREMLQLHLGSTEAVALIHWPRTGRYGASLIELENGVISHEIVATDAASTGTMLQVRADVVDWFRDLYREYGRAWTTGDRVDVARLYAVDAVVTEPLIGISLVGAHAIAESATESSVSWRPMTISELTGQEPGEEDDRDAVDALFLAVTEFGKDPELAIGVYAVDQVDGCVVRMAVSWHIEKDSIATERRYPEVESLRSCNDGELPNGWWTGLGLPVARENIATGVVDGPSGDIEIRNGEPALAELVSWGLKRFSEAGLPQPDVDSITFEPTRQCAGVAGKVIDTGGRRDLFLCVDQDDLFGSCPECGVPLLSARLGMLHELGHAWMLDHVDSADEERILKLSGRQVWADLSVPWRDRGVEYSAEVIAWGLLDSRVRLIRVGDPPCEELRRSFEALTGASPLPPNRDCAA